MISVDFTQVVLKNLITHHIGNKLRDDQIKLSAEESELKPDTLDFLLKYFLQPFNTQEFYEFSHSVSLEMNEVYQLANKIFSKNKNFIKNSQNIATLLYEYSLHPKIKAGELNIVFFSNIKLNDDTVNAIGIFKSESSIPYLKMKSSKNQYSISHDFGFEIKAMDKGCLVFNLDAEKGYKILNIDSLNKSEDAQYWKKDFLKLSPVQNEYHFTNNFLKLTKQYIISSLPEEQNLSAADQADLLNRSVKYFKENETFNVTEFQNEVFQDTEIIKSFQDFGSSYLNENNINIADSFEISSQAVKKQARAFKSVIKLDKNFHIYIHGNREMIEQGYDEKTGRKFYKIYFDNEF